MNYILFSHGDRAGALPAQIKMYAYNADFRYLAERLDGEKKNPFAFGNRNLKASAFTHHETCNTFIVVGMHGKEELSWNPTQGISSFSLEKKSCPGCS